MIYLDSNLFLYAFLHTGEKAERARTLLDDVKDGNQTAATASLTVDEVIWAASKARGRSFALELGEGLMTAPHLRVLPVGAEDMRAAIAFMKEYPRIAPRDAVHTAVAWNAGIFTIASDDTDFDVIREIERWPL